MARKGENIYKRKDGRWEGRYIKGRTLSGKALYGYVYAKSYGDVKNKLVAAKSTVNNANNHLSKTFEDISVLWLKSILTYCKKSTFAKYKNTLENHLLPEFGQCDISKITVIYNSKISRISDYLLNDWKHIFNGFGRQVVK